MNEVILIGRLTKDPELSYTQNNNARCVFTIAVDRPRREGEEAGADFIRIVVWNRQAENCGRYLHKGSQCAVSGAIRTGSYENKVGARVYTTDVWANRVEFLGSGEKSSSNARNNENGNTYQRDNFNASESNFASFDDLPDTFQAAEDDIPF